jgi:hypothetical protein
MGSISLAVLIQSIAPAQGGITGTGFFEILLLREPWDSEEFVR